MTTQTTVSDLKINKLTSAQYATITPSNTELYFITDDSGITSADVTNALGYTPNKKVTATSPALTQSGGVLTWTITHSLGADVNVTIRLTSTGEVIIPNGITQNSNNTVVTILSASNATAGTYTATIEG